MSYLKLIADLSNAYGISGFEDQVLDVVAANKGDFTLEVDHMKNGYLNLGAKDPNKPTVMLDSHLDEVGFMVAYIASNGQIGMQAIGGWVASSVQSQKFAIKNRWGKYISAVSSSKPPHFMTATEKEKTLHLTDLRLDVGASSAQEARELFGIEVGQPVTPAVTFDYLEEKQVMLGKAFDNRLGVAAVLAVFQELGDQVADLPFNLVGSFASQEEVGLRGAKITSRLIDPQMAIVFEATPSDDFAKESALVQGSMGKGPQLRYRDSTYIASDYLNQRFVDLAVQESIAIQKAVRAGGGTNAGAISLNNKGVEILTLGVPARYAHTHHLLASYQDFSDMVTLTVAFLKSLKASDFARYQLQEKK